jgi:hypothetical protein
MNKYYVSGLIGSGIPGFIVLVFLTFSLGIFLWVLALPTWLIGGLSAGYLGETLSTFYPVTISFPAFTSPATFTCCPPCGAMFT